MDGLKVGTTSFVGQPDAMSEALDSNLKFTESGTGNWWLASGTDNEYYYEADAAQGTTPDSTEACLQAIVDSDSSQTVKFYWKVSSEQRGLSTSLGTPALPRPKRTGCSAITWSSISTAPLRTRSAGRWAGTAEVLRRQLGDPYPPRGEAVPALCRGSVPPLQYGPEARETQGQDALATGGLRTIRPQKAGSSIHG